ncbi:putative nuclease HARBI1 [Helicoverpa armigera]|uniref:putative nuclease HARBI1 n=1 Tax=Helicoverpa armigera TaxID=29058 RepID=UPI003083D60B
MATRMLLIEAALREDRVERRRNRRRLRNQLNINEIPDVEFVGNYRLNRQLFEELCQELVPLLPPKARRHGIEPTIKILTALNFYARGCYQGSVGQNLDGPLAQQTVSRCLKEVTTALNAPHIVRKYIKFPQNINERNLIKRQFYDKYGLPGVIGCIDCTHIAIVRPSEHEEQYFNRKHFHSLNTQVICDSDCYITNVDASFGGATHDAYIWRECDIRSHLEGLQNETVYLLGDSGYALREHMMTPIDNAVEDSPEGRYNFVQKRARSTIERTFGILKGRWRCLLSARELHYCPETAGKIVIACCVLHNLCLRGGMDAPEMTEDQLQVERSRQVPPSQSATSSAQALQAGRRARALLVQILERNR